VLYQSIEVIRPARLDSEVSLTGKANVTIANGAAGVRHVYL